MEEIKIAQLLLMRHNCQSCTISGGIRLIYFVLGREGKGKKEMEREQGKDNLSCIRFLIMSTM